MSRISAIRDGNLDVSWLNITSLPELPETLTHLWCYHTQLSVLPKLPKTFTHLNCSNTQLSILQAPSCSQDGALKSVSLCETDLPKLPETLRELYCSNIFLKILRNDGERVADYSKRWDAWRAEQAYIKRCNEKCLAFRDELVDAAEFVAFSSELA